MPDDVQGAPADSPQPDASTAPSADAVPVQDPSTQAPPDGTPSPDSTFHMPPEARWNELRQQRQEAIDRATRAEQMAQMALQRLQQPSPQPVQDVDPYAGMTPEMAEFYRQMDRRIEQRAQAVASQMLQPIMQVVDAGRQELAQVKIAEFRRQNQDIQPASAEERAVIAYMNGEVDGMRHTLESARNNVLSPRFESENRTLKAKQASVGQKLSANASGPTASIPATAGLPGRPGNWRDTVRQAFRKGGDLSAILNAAGATRTTEQPAG